MKIIAYFIIICLITLVLYIETDNSQNNKFSNIKILIISVMVSVYSGLLGTQGLPDRVNYLERFHSYSKMNITFDLIKNYDEFGYVILNIIIGKVTQSSFLFFFIITFIVTFINLYVLKKINNQYKLAFIFYFISLMHFN